MSKPFELTSNFKPAGDQPIAIKELIHGLEVGLAYQTLLVRERRLVLRMLCKKFSARF